MHMAVTKTPRSLEFRINGSIDLSRRKSQIETQVNAVCSMQ
jgi:hypothetical protein